MNFSDTLVENLISELEHFKFLQEEFIRMNAEIKKLDLACQMAYSCGYHDRKNGKGFDRNFQIKDLK